MKNLCTLNVSHNRIRRIEGLAGLDRLKTLDVSHNLIVDINDCEQVIELPALTNLDIRDNQIDNHRDIVPFFTRMEKLTCLYLAGNPCVRNISHYRRSMTTCMAGLYYLDDKPIFEDERLLAEAFVRGGKEEELKVKVDLEEKKRIEMALSKQKAMNDPAAKEKRKAMFKKMMNEVQTSKSDLIKEHRELKEKIRDARAGNPDKDVWVMKLKNIEDRLKGEKFTQMYGDDMQKPPEASKPSPFTNKTFIEDIERKARAEKAAREAAQTEEGKEEAYQR